MGDANFDDYSDKRVKCYIVIFVEPDSTAVPGGRTTAQVC